MAEKIKVSCIGLGARGLPMVQGVLCTLVESGEIDIVSVCDIYEDRYNAAADAVEKACGVRPLCTNDYRTALSVPGLNACLIMTAWESHIEIALYAMERGIRVGMEVGGAYSVDDCFKLTKMYEKTGVHCMMLENCCYGRRELMVLNMVRRGVFGEIVHCSGGYMHDLRSEISGGIENRHYRLRNYLNRNCDNYPTHELGPIAKVLDINRGNRLLSLTSVASKSAGINAYVADRKGADSPLASAHFAQGDVVTTTIKCARGETIILTLDTTLPRVYSRGFTVRGTKGLYNEDADYVYIDGQPELPIVKLAGNAKDYEEEYEHPLWREYREHPVGGHEGIDWLVYNAFFSYVRDGGTPPIDTYDTATLMCISALSEASISAGGAPQAIPDFTRGAWILRTETPDKQTNPYALD